MHRLRHLMFTLLLSTLLAACGTDSSSGGDSVSGSGSSRTEGVTVSGVSSKKSAFSLRATDAPVDGMVAVVLSFTEITIRNAEHKVVSYRYDSPRSVDLLQLQGSTTADLLIDMPLDDGEYHDIRLLVDDSPMANYVDLGAGGLVELDVIDGSTAGFRIDHEFTVTRSRPASLVVDFDLRMSIIESKPGEYQFDPEMRLVSLSDSSHIRGTVDPAKLASATECSDADVDSFNAAYVYEGHNATLDDINQGKKSKKSKKTKKPKKSGKSVKAAGDYRGPVSTTVVSYDSDSMTYLYEAAFLPTGEYTVAITCNADLEKLNKSGDNLRFFDVRNATVKINDILFL